DSAHPQARWGPRCSHGLSYPASRNWAAEICWQRTRRRGEISKIPLDKCSRLFLSSAKPDEFALGSWIMASIDQGRRCLLIRHSGFCEGIADKNRGEIAPHLIKSGDGLRSHR